MTPPADPLIALALQVAREADAIGVRTAVIGAMALAHHFYLRATDDLDLGACTGFNEKLRPLAERLRSLGLFVELHEPDAHDPLDGVLRVSAAEGGEKVEIVNIGHTKLGLATINRAEEPGDGFRYARLPELIALKLYAGGAKSKRDIEAVLEANPDADLGEIRRVCLELGFSKEVDLMLPPVRDRD